MKDEFNFKKGEINRMRYFKSLSRSRQIIYIGIIEFLIIVILPFFLIFPEPWLTFLKGNGIWTLITLLVSAPIAFFIWWFRDENARQQLEHQRKDVNLKEFQKIAEWAAGLHLVEDKIVEKQENGSNIDIIDIQEVEHSREYGQAGKERNLSSHSRQDGAVGLQIAAIYMLKPFYCGEHGENFCRPALNLLTSAWLALFKQAERQKSGQANSMNLKAEELRQSPLAIALTEVLLADGGKHIRQYPEVFPNLYLPYLNLHLPGLDPKVLNLFSMLDCRGIDLRESDLSKANLVGAKLARSDLSGANLSSAQLSPANLSETNLSKANLNLAILSGAILSGANLRGANLSGANLSGADLSGADLSGADLRRAKLSRANLSEVGLNGANLCQANLNEADLRGASLFKTYLNEADLNGVKLNDAYLGGANFGGVDLTKAEVDSTNWDYGAILDNSVAEAIRPKLGDSWTKIIKAPSQSIEDDLVSFRFSQENRAITHQLPATINIQELERMNPEWKIVKLL